MSRLAIAALFIVLLGVSSVDAAHTRLKTRQPSASDSLAQVATLQKMLSSMNSASKSGAMGKWLDDLMKVLENLDDEIKSRIDSENRNIQRAKESFAAKQATEDAVTSASKSKISSLQASIATEEGIIKSSEDSLARAVTERDSTIDNSNKQIAGHNQALATVEKLRQMILGFSDFSGANGVDQTYTPSGYVDEDFCRADSCGENADCKTIKTVPTCSCKANYVSDGTTCKLDNPCLAADAGKCNSNAYCVYSGVGQSQCKCKDGFEGDGVTCTQKAGGWNAQLQGKSVSCASVSSTAVYTQCDDMKMDGSMRFSNGVNCGPAWDTQNPRYPSTNDMLGFCQALHGRAFSKFEVYWSCEASIPRVSWISGAWGSNPTDNGYVKSLRCYY